VRPQKFVPDACSKACPTNAINSDRFLLYGERCITFHNEQPGEFAASLDPSWHHCLVGCMICQKVCPVNKDLRKWITKGPSFSEEETASILKSTQENELPRNTVNKLDKLYVLEYLNVLGRNLEALIKKARLN
jgi:epoxyqueuosine reductase